MNIEEYHKFYIDIGKLIWNIMPAEASEYIFQYEIFDETESCKVFWFDKCGIKKGYSMDNYPNNIIKELRILFSKLHKVMGSNGDKWTHCQFTLKDNQEFDFYSKDISQEDSWNMLYMKGISDLTWEEAQEYYIPREIWEERVRLKNSQS